MPALRDAPRVGSGGANVGAEHLTSSARISRLLLLLEQYLKLCENTMEREFVQSHQPHARSSSSVVASASSSTSSASWDVGCSNASASALATRSADSEPFFMFLRYFPPHAHTFYGVTLSLKLTLTYSIQNAFPYNKPDIIKSQMNLLVCKLLSDTHGTTSVSGPQLHQTSTTKLRLII